MEALLNIENLYVRFGATEAVLGMALDIDEGEVLGLVGESKQLLAAVPTLRTDRETPLARVAG